MTTRLTTLANGIRVVTRSMPHVETVALGLHVDTGARSETEATNGVAHLLEHMVFKGTATRSARRIAEEIEDVGGSLNAYTARDMTVFHARLLSADTQLGMEMIADLVRAPRFDEEELEREKAVVLQELGEARDTPDDIVFDHLQAAAFPDQSIGRSILGSEASIAALTSRDLRDWLDVQYRGGSCIVAAAGKVDHDALVTLSEALYGDLGPGVRPGTAPAVFAAGVIHDRRKFEQAHLTLGLPAPGHHDPDFDAIALFVTAAGGGASSRLFQELREERGLAYSVYASTTPYADAGLFSVYLATAKKDAGRAMDLAVQVLADTASGLRPDELARAKAQVRAGVLMSLESPGGWAEYLARQLLAHGYVKTPADIVARIEAVDLDTVRAASARMVAGPYAVADVGAAAVRRAA
ncbi:insulinase family protein [Polymorphobacter sp. PAMC 29334]|uniref:M16 family metallopeptidase n=1 Tax=Polymorphobacter sp. PAMC 29334 TaxID=2862331 RepID=UPI001C686EFE|nr:pitrilysin family protein [Polymorphobacter sp. PAMC 29334]QYE34824.1 insulinase family protein [Polymorphobacter sp. PAMC 29334]